jgi:hypothetical protein
LQFGAAGFRRSSRFLDRDDGHFGILSRRGNLSLNTRFWRRGIRRAFGCLSVTQPLAWLERGGPPNCPHPAGEGVRGRRQGEGRPQSGPGRRSMMTSARP